MEHYGINLKEFLLNSRTLTNYPSYATKEQRCSTLHEAQGIDIALGIARGMCYLQSLSVRLFLEKKDSFLEISAISTRSRFLIRGWPLARF